MRSRFLKLIPGVIRLPVLYVPLVLGVVGIQAVFIAHTHKMITGQPLLLGQDHRSLAHLPPFIFRRIRDTHNGSASISPSSNPVPEASSDDDWDRVLIIPFISLAEEGNYYTVVVEAPGLTVSNIEVRMNGRELSLSSSFVTLMHHTGAIVQTREAEHRIRFPGPVSETGPPVAEALSAGRLRVAMRKASPKRETEPASRRQ